MKNFPEWLKTAPAYVQPRSESERIRMDYAYTEALLQAADETIELMQQSMLRGVQAGTDAS